MGVEMVKPPVIWCDNSGVIVSSENPVYHSKAKHVELDVHFVREKVSSGSLQVNYVPTRHQLADGLTKPISKCRFDEFRRNLGVLSLEEVKSGESRKNVECILELMMVIKVVVSC
ncbi:hypothetical protein GQ457_03G023600 [Hibiscus cannabinus]